jgi:hypothetical protein
MNSNWRGVDGERNLSMFEVELHKRGVNHYDNGQWHIGEDFPMFSEEDIIKGRVLIQADGDELEYLEYVFGVNSAFRTFKCTGDVAQNILLNMSGINWITLKNALMASMETISERRKWCEAHGFSNALGER